MILQWDTRKATANSRKHGVTFEEAAAVFRDPGALTFADPDHSQQELREITIGHTSERRLLFVSHCDRDGQLRLISARTATPRERRQYEKGIEPQIQ